MACREAHHERCGLSMRNILKKNNVNLRAGWRRVVRVPGIIKSQWTIITRNLKYKIFVLIKQFTCVSRVWTSAVFFHATSYTRGGPYRAFLMEWTLSVDIGHSVLRHVHRCRTPRMRMESDGTRLPLWAYNRVETTLLYRCGRSWGHTTTKRRTEIAEYDQTMRDVYPSRRRLSVSRWSWTFLGVRT